MMKRFEYQFIKQSTLSLRTTDALLKYFNMHGADGWELCGIDYGCLIFKREIIK